MTTFEVNVNSNHVRARDYTIEGGSNVVRTTIGTGDGIMSRTESATVITVGVRLVKVTEGCMATSTTG